MSVTLKELRISKGLNQAQCAEYLGMSTRNYQNYENDAAKANTARYHAIYQKLESYGQPVVSVSLPSQTTEFHTNVVTGTGLQALANSVAKYGKRDCFSTLQKFVAGSYDGNDHLHITHGRHSQFADELQTRTKQRRVLLRYGE